MPARAGNDSTCGLPAASLPCLVDVPHADLISNPKLLQGAPCVAECANAETLLPCGVRPLEHQRRYTHLSGIVRIKKSSRYSWNNAKHHTCKGQKKSRHSRIGRAYPVERERSRESAIASSHNDDISLRQFLWCTRHRGWCAPTKVVTQVCTITLLDRCGRCGSKSVMSDLSLTLHCAGSSHPFTCIGWAYMKSVTVTSKA